MEKAVTDNGCKNYIYTHRDAVTFKYLEKYDFIKENNLKADIIGHLQTNKLKMVLPYVSLVQSVDSVRLLEAINAWGVANNKTINVLLELHVASEDTKQGLSADETIMLISRTKEFPALCIKGIMGMATFTDDESVIKSDFTVLREIFDICRSRFPDLADDFSELSMGMSDDYPIAVAMGSTIVRIGSMIFGERN